MFISKEEIDKLKLSKDDVIEINNKENKCVLTKTMFKTLLNVIIKRPEFGEISNYIDGFFETDKQHEIFDIDQVYPEINTLISKGGSEGTYLDIYLHYRNGLGYNEYPLGFVKSLDESMDGYIALGKLSAMFVYFGHLFLIENNPLLNKRNEYGIVNEKTRDGINLLKIYNSPSYPLFASSLKSGLLVYSDKDIQNVLKINNVLSQVFYVVEEIQSQKRKNFCIKKEIADVIPQNKIKEEFGCITKYVYFHSYEEAFAYKEIMQESN